MKVMSKIKASIRKFKIKLPPMPRQCQWEDPQKLSDWNEPDDLPSKTTVVPEADWKNLQFNLKYCIQAICDLLQKEQPWGAQHSAKLNARIALRQLREAGVNFKPHGEEILAPENKPLPSEPTTTEKPQ